VTQFRQHILHGAWAHAEPLLIQLGVTDEDALMDARFLIGKQKYLELLEAQKTTAALQVLRNDLAPYSTTSEQDELHALSRCAPEISSRGTSMMTLIQLDDVFRS